MTSRDTQSSYRPASSSVEEIMLLLKAGAETMRYRTYTSPTTIRKEFQTAYTILLMTLNTDLPAVFRNCTSEHDLNLRKNSGQYIHTV